MACLFRLQAKRLVADRQRTQGAWLPFVPTAGNTYTLTASLTGVGVGQSTADVAWWALGFAKALPTNAESAAGNRFIEAPTLGRAWMLFRPNNPGTNANQVQIGNATTGTGTSIPWTAGTPTGGGDVDMQIVVDTTASTWTGSFYAKRPTDVSYTFITTQNILQDITGMVHGTTATAGTVLNGMINHFKLETSGSVFLAGDVNGDQAVNDLDFNIIRDHLFSSGTRIQGDLTNDGTVDFRDFPHGRLHMKERGREQFSAPGCLSQPARYCCYSQSEAFSFSDVGA